MTSQPAPIPVYQGQDFYVPAFEFKLAGRPADQEVIRDVIQVSYKDSLEEIDSFDLTINNWDARQRDFKYIDQDLFDPGKEAELSMGYLGRGGMRSMLKGAIASLRPSFPAAGQPTLVVTGLNLLDKLRKKQETHVYRNMTDNEIAKQVAGRLQVGIEVVENAAGSSEKYGYILQDNQYDIVFLMERARRIGYDLFVKERNNGRPVLQFKPSDKVKQLTYELDYGRSLNDFSPNLNTSNQVMKVTVQSWNPVKKKAIKVTMGRGDVDVRDPATMGGRNFTASFKDKEEVITGKPVHTEQEARTLARETMSKIVKNMLTATGNVIGLPDLRAGTALQIGGLGEYYSGRYFVTSTTHTISDGGYLTQFQCRREEPK